MGHGPYRWRMSSAALPGPVKTALVWIGKIPFLSVILLAILLQIMRENYPFSHLPMYSGLTKDVDYYFITDAKGEPMPQGIYFGFSTSKTKKMFNTRLRKISKGGNTDSASEAQIAEAGKETLEYMMAHIREDRRAQVEKSGIQLHRVTVAREGEHLEKHPSIVAEIPPK